ncbi:phage tail tape measure protein [Algicola sagamiensis]|uniref:phage tail tape measure protein n=1 Tax=Algicola sagamiensis TaxID=163869 RepID=UPI00036163B3|nr:phage tail tape measure protein [Algicola sagamiensis]
MPDQQKISLSARLGLEDKFSKPAKTIGASAGKLASTLEVHQSKMEKLGKLGQQTKDLSQLEMKLGSLGQSFDKSAAKTAKAGRAYHAAKVTQNQWVESVTASRHEVSQLNTTMGQQKELIAELQKKKTGHKKADKEIVERIKKEREQLKLLNEQHRKAKKVLAERSAQEKKAAADVRDLGQQFEKTKAQSDKLKNAHQSHKQKASALRHELRQAGVDTRQLATEQNRLAASLEKSQQRMASFAAYERNIRQSRRSFDRRLQQAGNLALIGQGMQSIGHRTLGMARSPLDEMRQVEKGKGALQSLGMTDTQSTIAEGRRIQNRYAGMKAADIVTAAYDIKSGISSLTDKGVAEWAGLAAMTAKATKAEVGQMTSLFAAGYGTFKETLYKQKTDDEFGAVFSAGLAKSVQQFRTDGASMQQGFQSMGAGLAVANVPLAEQFTALGMLQRTDVAGSSGTVMAALERNAAKAQTAYQKQGADVRILNEQGNINSLPQLLAELQQHYGQRYTSKIGADIQKAFGSEEAVKFFKALWGQQAAFRENQSAVSDAMKQGKQFTESMARLMDRNMDAKLSVMQQRWDGVKERIGYALIPTLERLMPSIESLTGWLTRTIEKNQGLTSTLLQGVGVVGLVASVAAPAVIAVSSLTMAIAALSYMADRTKGKLAMSALADEMDGDGKRRKGKRGRFKFSKGKALGAIGTVAGVAAIGSTLFDGELSGKEKAANIAEDTGAIGGALAGGKLGAVAGTAVMPGLGSGIGALIGGIVGALSGGALGGLIGDAIKGEPEPTPQVQAIKKELNTTAQTLSQHQKITQHINVNIDSQPVVNIAKQDFDKDALIEDILEASANRQRLQLREALADVG